MTDQRPLVEKVLDLVLYAPAGLVAQVTTDLPKLVADGRARLENRVKVAHWIGEMAVTTGRKELDKRLHPPQTTPRPATARAASGAAGGHPPFEGYDQLAAAQIVQLLPRLPHVELQLIRAHEAAGRGRRTILNKIQQLLGD